MAQSLPSPSTPVRSVMTAGWRCEIGGELFGVFENHAHRLAGLLGEKIANRRFGDRGFAAEVAAHRKNMDFDVLLFEAEIAREAAAQRKRRFVRRPNLDPAVVVDLHRAGVRLDIAVKS